MTAPRSGESGIRGRLLRRPGWLAGGAVLLAFWVVFWGQTADSVLTRIPVLDEAHYFREAARLGNPTAGDSPAIMSPLYPRIVATVGGARSLDGGVLDRQPRGLLVLQALAWVTVGLLVSSTVRRAGRDLPVPGSSVPVAALATGAALLFWLYRPAAIYGRTVLLEIPLAVAATIWLRGLTSWALRTHPPPWWQGPALGFVLGLAGLLRAHTLVLWLPAVWLVWRRGRRAGPAASRPWLLLGLGLTVGVLFPIFWASAHNTRVTGRLAGPSLNGGINLYLGHASGAGGFFATLPGLDLESDPGGREYLANVSGETVTDAGAADRRWYTEVFRRWRERPWRVPSLWLRKVWLHLQGWEIAQITPLSAWTKEAPVLSALWLPYALMVGLGLTGAVTVLGSRPRPAGVSADEPDAPLRRVAWLWAASLLLLIATQSLFFVVSRYRLVLVPSLAVLAGLGAVRLWSRLSARGGSISPWATIRVPALVLLATLLVTVPWGLTATRRHWSILEAENHALRLERLMVVRSDRILAARPEAEALYRRSRELDPSRSQPYQGLARLMALAGRSDEAVAILAEGMRFADDPVPLQRELIARLLTVGRESDAHAQLMAYLREHPEDADMLHNLVVLLGRRGQWRQAEAVARSLREVAPADPRGFIDLAAALARQNRREEARAVLEAGLKRLPGQPELVENLRRLGTDE